MNEVWHYFRPFPPSPPLNESLSNQTLWRPSPPQTAFLSYLRLSVYLSIVAVAIVLSFHLRKTASEMELRIAKPLGAIFWILSVGCLCVGVANYLSMSSPPIRFCVHHGAPR